VPFALFLGVAPLVRWKRQSVQELFKPLLHSLLLTVLISLVYLYSFASHFTWLALMGVFLGFWVLCTTCYELYLRATHRNSLFSGLTKLGYSHWAMSVGHAGFAVLVIGITMTQNYSIERDVKLAVGESITFEDYDFHFDAVQDLQGKNYTGTVGVFTVSSDGDVVTTMGAEKRLYTVQRMPMTEAAIDGGITRDLYIAMGEVLPDGAWAVRIYYKPFIRWIWFGPLMMGFAGMLMMMDRRYRVKKLVQEAS